uniref:Uncharacterized protein n=1 Tax=Arundo donax TaxID=35708 RepID=A0A0A9B207_ARUDO
MGTFLVSTFMLQKRLHSYQGTNSVKPWCVLGD